MIYTRGRRFATTKSRIRWTTSAFHRIVLRKHSNIEKCLKNLDLLNRLLDQKWIYSDKERKNCNEKYDVKIMKGNNTGSIVEESGRPRISQIQDFRRPANKSRVAKRNYPFARIGCATEFHPIFCYSRLDVWDESPRDKQRLKVFQEIQNPRRAL